MTGCRLACLCLALTVTVAAVAQDSQSVTLVSPGEGPAQKLEYKFTPGQFVHYEVDHKMTIITQKGETKAKAVNESQAWKQYRVVTIDEQGLATLEPLVSRVKMRAQFEDLPATVYDSGTDTAPPKGFEAIAETVGRAQIRAVFAPNGELVRVIPLPGAPEHLANAAGKVEAQHNFLIVLPKTAVGTGAVWRDRFQVPVSVGKGLSQQVTLQRQYALTGIKDGIATIAFKTSVVTPINNPEVEGQLIQRTPSGSIEFDIEKGLIVSQTASVNQQVVGPLGPDTLLQASSQSHEKLVPASTAVQPTSLRR